MLFNEFNTFLFKILIHFNFQNFKINKYSVFNPITLNLM